MFILFISNHTVFPVQFGINLQLWVFQKAEIALAETPGRNGSCSFSFLKNPLVRIVGFDMTSLKFKLENY